MYPHLYRFDFAVLHNNNASALQILSEDHKLLCLHHIFAQYKSNIIITGRRKGRLERLKHELEQQYSLKVLTSCFDIHNRNACKSLVNSIDP